MHFFKIPDKSDQFFLHVIAWFCYSDIIILHCSLFCFNTYTWNFYPENMTSHVTIDYMPHYYLNKNFLESSNARRSNKIGLYK